MEYRSTDLAAHAVRLHFKKMNQPTAYRFFEIWSGTISTRAAKCRIAGLAANDAPLNEVSQDGSRQARCLLNCRVQIDDLLIGIAHATFLVARRKKANSAVATW